jgi:protein-L-isoaspartate(D-aspartate) O-methyltransferase
MGHRTDHLSDALRHDLVDRLVADGTVRSPAVEDALRRVPRERFLPDRDPELVYEDRAQLLKRDRDTTLSTISQPTMVAIMLELADLAPGQRVLEIGTGSGYNAALLARLVGPSGRVVTVDVESDLVETAERTLGSLGFEQVSAHTADGRNGWPAAAPYDRVMATVGVDEVPAAWREQVADGGLLVVPLLDPPEVRVERRTAPGWELVATSPASFIPLR